MAPSHRFNSSFEPDEYYNRTRAVKIAEEQIFEIVRQLEAAQSLTVTEIFPHDNAFADDGVVICWELDKSE